MLLTADSNGIESMQKLSNEKLNSSMNSSVVGPAEEVKIPIFEADIDTQSTGSFCKL
jgi:hypothetical protein